MSRVPCRAARALTIRPRCLWGASSHFFYSLFCLKMVSLWLLSAAFCFYFCKGVICSSVIAGEKSGALVYKIVRVRLNGDLWLFGSQF